ncbi:hypothetical protein KC319_g8950 [Hortaea werneckii]|nr:hypothetical protein KC323_g6211 [Hortaea werneckii]KAI6875362.1 hypothetical protein KC338_g862 [Hortaea werneckii]KAI7215764.1 hypothetical protein KC352_g16658 [Hortaea werneckii]KAI7561657.1 hypothetical protein KC317_g8937 [Hortaea werneckii]KAI7612343.1 hypothetical protein KC346_g7878 [Hortaea werneckii]
MNSFDLRTDDAGRSLQGSTMLVTGGASGFGEAIVASLFRATQDIAVIIADVNEENGLQVERKLVAEGRKAKFVQVDMTSWASVVGLFRTALRWLQQEHQVGTIDHVFGIAGVPSEGFDPTPISPAEFLSHDELPKAPSTLSEQVSVLGNTYLTQAAIKYGMGLHEHPEQANKSITLMGSLSAYTAIPLHCDYSASKWGVRGLFKSLLDATEVEDLPFRVNLIAPYYVKTPLTAPRVALLESLGVKFGEVADVAAAATRLCADRTVHGRAIGVWQGGAFDLCDDMDGGFGSHVLQQGIAEEKLLVPRRKLWKAQIGEAQ